MTDDLKSLGDTHPTVHDARVHAQERRADALQRIVVELETQHAADELVIATLRGQLDRANDELDTLRSNDHE